MLQLWVALPDAESAALPEKELSPAAVGVPVIVPVAVFSAKPAGSAPVVENV